MLRSTPTSCATSDGSVGDSTGDRVSLRSSPPPQHDARQRGDQGAEGVAPHLEVAVLVVGGAGGGEQHDGLGRAARCRIARRRGERRIERAAALEADLAVERGRELLARLADQVGPGDAREDTARGW